MFIVEFHHARNPRDRRQILLGSDRRRKNAAPEKAKDAELDKYFGAASAGNTKRAQAEGNVGQMPSLLRPDQFRSELFPLAPHVRIFLRAHRAQSIRG